MKLNKLKCAARGNVFYCFAIPLARQECALHILYHKGIIHPSFFQHNYFFIKISKKLQTSFITIFCHKKAILLPEQIIRYQHHAKAYQQRIGCSTLIAVGMGFRNHFVTDDIEHGSTGKRQGKRQNCRRNAHRKISD